MPALAIRASGRPGPAITEDRLESRVVLQGADRPVGQDCRSRSFPRSGQLIRTGNSSSTTQIQLPRSQDRTLRHGSARSPWECPSLGVCVPALRVAPSTEAVPGPFTIPRPIAGARIPMAAPALSVQSLGRRASLSGLRQSLGQCHARLCASRPDPPTRALHRRKIEIIFAFCLTYVLLIDILIPR